jgi:hypothetical protein
MDDTRRGCAGPLRHPGLRVRHSHLISLRAANGYAVLIYHKPGHVPAAHTILNFPVDDIEAAVDELRSAGVAFEQYEEGPLKTNEQGIATPGPKQAWFKDPAGNILSVIEG